MIEPGAGPGGDQAGISIEGILDAALAAAGAEAGAGAAELCRNNLKLWPHDWYATRSHQAFLS